MFVYVIVCSETLKIYIGQHKKESLTRYLQQKWWQAHHHLTARSHLYAAMRKYARDSWSIHPLVSDVRTRGELDELERHYIRALNTQHHDVGYNICDGGEGFTGPHSESARQKMSKIQSKLHRTPERKRIMSDRAKALWAHPEKKREMAEAIKNSPGPTRFLPGQASWNAGTQGIMKPNAGSFQPGHVKSPNSGATRPNSGSFSPGHKRGVGRKFTEDHLRNLSLSHMGKPNADKGKKRSGETKQKMKDAWVLRKARARSI
jgi:hypothetical protein